ncbi:MAG TPA: competence/damage-inducible protein A [Planctomycetaceae bacterium]|nr:competence/damage-inducible protein A [Planctomycetaceae bacterium]
MQTPTAEVIAIGDEMTSGARLDTNSQWLCQRLGELGITVRFTTMVGDQMQDNVDVFRAACNRVDFVISTGGLGPTADDLTRDAIALACDRPLELSESALRHIESMFKNRQREMPPRNRVQAMFPQGALEIHNPRGTAPGVDITATLNGQRTSRIFALPGVPAEMMEMFDATVTPRIIDQIGGGRLVIKNAVIKCFGIGESDMETRLGEMISRARFPRVGITVSAATISLRIAAQAETEADCDDMIRQTRAEILASAGEFVFGEGEKFELQHALTEILVSRNERIGTIESGHGSRVCNWMSDVQPGDTFIGGVVTNQFDHSAVSLRARMSQPGSGVTGADWLLAIEGYPSLNTEDDIVAELVFTFCGHDQQHYWQSHQRLGGHPGILHARIGKAALAFARSCLFNLGN